MSVALTAAILRSCEINLWASDAHHRQLCIDDTENTRLDFATGEVDQPEHWLLSRWSGRHFHCCARVCCGIDHVKDENSRRWTSLSKQCQRYGSAGHTQVGYGGVIFRGISQMKVTVAPTGS